MQLKLQLKLNAISNNKQTHNNSTNHKHLP